MTKTRIILGLLCAAAVAAAFWIGGYDFNERGYLAVSCYFLCLFAFVAVITFPK